MGRGVSAPFVGPAAMGKRDGSLSLAEHDARRMEIFHRLTKNRDGRVEYVIPSRQVKCTSWLFDWNYCAPFSYGPPRLLVIHSNGSVRRLRQSRKHWKIERAASKRR